jgi:NitT/TauT family transport system substrate-binding protein
MFNPRAVLVAMAIGIAGTGAGFAQTEVKVGYISNSDLLPTFIAKDKGIFDKLGINVTLTRIAIISNMPAALISGSINIGMSTGPGFLQATEGGLDLVIPGGIARNTPGNSSASLVAGKDSGITRPSDMKGKKLGVPGIGSMFDLLTRKWLVNNNVKPSDVISVEAPFPQMADLIRTKQIDAVLVIEPFRSRIVEEGGVRIVDFMDQVRRDVIMAFWISERTWASRNAQALVAFRQGVQEGLKFITDNPQEARAIEAKYLGANAKVLPTYESTVNVADLKFFQDLGKEFGLLKGTDDPAKFILKP